MQWDPWNLPFLPEVFGLHKVPPLSDERGQGTVLRSGRSGPTSCSSSGSAGTPSLGLITLLGRDAVPECLPRGSGEYQPGVERSAVFSPCLVFSV